MPRPWRVEFAGACYHVINRGNYRRDLFRSAGAAEAFERTLGEAAVRFGWRIHAYVVMSNHFHLAVELGEPNLSEGMKWLQGTWIRRFNSHRRLVGRPFQGRYKAILIESGPSFGRVCHYIHLNPVRAGIVEPCELARYSWGSLSKFPLKSRPAWLDPTTALSQAGGLPDTSHGWAQYLEYLEFLAEDPDAKKHLAAEKLSRGWCVGTTEFRNEVREQRALRGALLERYAGLEPDALQTERRNEWWRVLTKLAELAGVDLARLPQPKSHPDKLLLAAALRARSSARNRWIADALQLGSASSVGSLLSRFARSPKSRERLNRLLDQLA